MRPQGSSFLPVECDVLSGDDKGIFVGRQLQHLSGQVYRDDASGATHACNIAAHKLRPVNAYNFAESFWARSYINGLQQEVGLTQGCLSPALYFVREWIT